MTAASEQRFHYSLPFGAETLGQDGRTRFRLWAPSASQVGLRLGRADPIPMQPRQDGWFESEVACEPGTAYCYVVPHAGGTLEVPDPAARCQAEDVHGPSLVVDPGRHAWQHAGWRGRPWHETVLYELHAGTCGGFKGVTARLPALADLGITAVELMPIAEFPGARNWGYDGVLPYAPDSAYGTPEELKALIDTAHGLGMMVFLDVVYNHFGPDGNYLPVYAAPFFREDQRTPWGDGIDFRVRQVRDFFIHNALYWLMEYRFDGLRLDAVHAIGDSSWLRELAARVRATVEPGRHVHLVLENENNQAQLLEQDFSAQWNDDAHHVVHAALTGERESYYASYAAPSDPQSGVQLARWLSQGFVYQGEPMPSLEGKPRGEPSGHLPPTAFVTFLQNHDQVGNRALGERLVALAEPAAVRAAVALQLLCPQIPMLFMGEEWGCAEPFLFFTSHGPELADAVREGRRREFAQFPAFSDPARRERIPDPNDPRTFQASIADPSMASIGPHAQWLAYYRRLLALRREWLVPHLQQARIIEAHALGPVAACGRWRLDGGRELTLLVNLGARALPAVVPPSGQILFETPQGAGQQAAAGQLPAASCIAYGGPV
jgi:maltooligosyltrehalose trehalohydrolase